MSIRNLTLSHARRKAWIYGSVAMALIMGLFALGGADKVAAHEGLADNVPATPGHMVQVWDDEREEHVVHVHASNVETWEVYFGSSRALDCDTRQSGWRDANSSSRRADIISEDDGLTLTLNPGDHNLGICIRYTDEDVDDDTFVPDTHWDYATSNTDIAPGAKNPSIEYTNLVADLRGPSISIDAAESNMMGVEVDGLREGAKALAAEDTALEAPDANMRIRYTFLDSSACDATTLTDDTRHEAADTMVSGLPTSTITAPQAKNGVEFKIATAYATRDKYLCVEVTDQVGNAGYASKMVDVDFPVTLTQVPSSNDDGTGRVSVSSSESGVQFSYASSTKAAASYQVSSADCTDKPTDTVWRPLVPRGGYEYASTTHAICINVRDAKENKFKIIFIIDRDGPEIATVIQSNQIVYAIGSDRSTDVEANIAAAPFADVVRSSEGQIRWESRYIDALTYNGVVTTSAEALDDACSNETEFKGNGNTYATYTTGTRNSRIDLSKNSAYRDRYDAICFRVRDVANKEVYLGVVIDDFTVQPVIEGDRDESSPTLSLSITGVEGNAVWSWDKAQLTDNCSSENADFFRFSQPSPDSTITVEADAEAYCVRAIIGNDNYYGIVVGVADDETLDSDGPVVTVGDVDSNNMISATAEDSGSGVDADSWQYTVLADEDATRNCTDDPIQVIADSDWMDGSSFTATAAHSNKYVCFRVMDEVGNYGYNIMRDDANKPIALPTIEDITPPTLTVTQVGNTLAWSAQDDDGIATYEYQMFDSAPANCNTDSDWMDGMKATLAESDNGKHYCFRVTDHGGNATSAGPLAISGVDTTRPTVTVSQSGNSVTATAGEMGTSGWQSYRSDNDPGADCSDRYTGWSDVKIVEEGRQVTGLTDADSGKWLCFRTMDAAGNYGYKKHQIETITEADETDTQRETADGTVSHVVENGRLTVSLTPDEDGEEVPEVISWNYLYWSTESLADRYCAADTNQFDTTAPGTRNSFNLEARHYGKWFCFRAIDENNEEAFVVFQTPASVDAAPVVVTQPPATQPDDQATTGDQATTQPDPAETQTPGQPGDSGDVTTTPDPSDGGTTTPTTTDPGDDTTSPADPAPTDDEGGFLSDYLWYIIGAVVVVILIVVFVSMGGGKQRE